MQNFHNLKMAKRLQLKKHSAAGHGAKVKQGLADCCRSKVLPQQFGLNNQPSLEIIITQTIICRSVNQAKAGPRLIRF
jgi:hypothetical protein